MQIRGLFDTLQVIKVPMEHRPQSHPPASLLTGSLVCDFAFATPPLNVDCPMSRCQWLEGPLPAPQLRPGSPVRFCLVLASFEL